MFHASHDQMQQDAGHAEDGEGSEDTGDIGHRLRLGDDHAHTLLCAEKFGDGFIQFGSAEFPDWPAVLAHTAFLWGFKVQIEEQAPDGHVRTLGEHSPERRAG